MDGYDYLAGFLIFFLFFIYIVWFGYSIKEENQNNEANKVKINPYDNIPLHRKLIDKKNPKVGLFDLGNHILIVGFILVVIFLFGNQIFEFKSEFEVFSNYPEILDLIVKERQAVFKSDMIRSIVIVCIIALLFWISTKKLIKKSYSLSLIGLIILFDLWNIDMNYVNEDNFSRPSAVKTPFTSNGIDEEIMKDKSSFRIYESYRGFVNGRSSYFHNSISGYHAAKPKRMQDIYDFYLSKNKFNILNMLNVKYIVDLNENNALGLRLNEENLGDAWFIENIINVHNSNEEILSLNDLNYSRDCLSKDLPNKTFTLSETDNIVLNSRKSNELIYNYTAKSESFIVFSEAYYSKGWQAYIDGQKVDHYKINYLLRGMEVPKGDHEIKFIFNPGIIKTGSIIMASSNFILLVLIGLFFRKENLDV